MTADFVPRFDQPTLGVVDETLRPVALLGGSIYDAVSERRAFVAILADGFAVEWPQDALAILRHGASTCRALLLELREMRADAGVR